MSNESEILDLLNISKRTLIRYRSKYWTLGIHYYKPVQKIIYNKALIEDWMVNKDDPIAHQRAIDNYQRGLLSNQKKRR